MGDVGRDVSFLLRGSDTRPPVLRQDESVSGEGTWSFDSCLFETNDQVRQSDSGKERKERVGSVRCMTRSFGSRVFVFGVLYTSDRSWSLTLP